MAEADHAEYGEERRAAADVGIERTHAGGGNDLLADKGRRAVLLKIARDAGHNGNGNQHSGKRRHGDQRLMAAECGRADQRCGNGADHGDHREQEEIHSINLVNEEQECCSEEPRNDAGGAERIADKRRNKERARDAAEERRGQDAPRLIGILRPHDNAERHSRQKQHARDDAEDRQCAHQPQLARGGLRHPNQGEDAHHQQGKHNGHAVCDGV